MRPSTRPHRGPPGIPIVNKPVATRQDRVHRWQSLTGVLRASIGFPSRLSGMRFASNLPGGLAPARELRGIAPSH